MLRELFFYICTDEFAISWQTFIFFIVSLSLAFLIFTIARMKVLNKKFTCLHYVFFAFLLIVFYQMIPVVANQIAFLTYQTNAQKAIKYQEFAIKTALIPYQKGVYYINLAYIYRFSDLRDDKKSVEALDKAYEYIQSYKYICWTLKDSYYANIGNYDKAIEIAESSYIPSIRESATVYYIYKGDFQNALTLINKAIDAKLEEIKNTENERVKNQYIKLLQRKAYIIKKMGNEIEAETLYNAALELEKNPKHNPSYDEYVKFQDKLLKGHKELVRKNLAK